MKRYRQSVDEILEKLSPVGASWRDEHADEVVRKLESLPIKSSYSRDDLIEMFDLERTTRRRFDADLTVVRLFLDMSKDEFTAELRDRLDKEAMLKKHQEEFRLCRQSVYSMESSSIFTFSTTRNIRCRISTPATRGSKPPFQSLMEKCLKGKSHRQR